MLTYKSLQFNSHTKEYFTLNIIQTCVKQQEHGIMFQREICTANNHLICLTTSQAKAISNANSSQIIRLRLLQASEIAAIRKQTINQQQQVSTISKSPVRWAP